MPSTTARRYARAVFELAQEEGDLDSWQRRLDAIRRLLSVPELTSLLRNPAVSPAERLGLVEAMPAEDLGEEGRNLAKLLVEASEEGAAGDIAEEFSRLADEARGRIRAVVTTAVPLPDDERERLARSLSQRLGRQVRLECLTDAAILGGLVVQLGDRLVDASLRGRLQQLRRQLAGV